MKIEGLDYNTQRENLMMPEYGREIQNMIDIAIGLPTREQRQKAAKTIISVMRRMSPQPHGMENGEQKYWDHLALMSAFRLDIDWPYDVSKAVRITTKPEPIEYPMSDIPVRHYGKLLFELFDKLMVMDEGPELDRLIAYTANQMKRCLVLWGHTSSADEKVVDDLARYTNGRIQLDLSSFKFEKVDISPEPEHKRKKK